MPKVNIHLIIAILGLSLTLLQFEEISSFLLLWIPEISLETFYVIILIVLVLLSWLHGFRFGARKRSSEKPLSLSDLWERECNAQAIWVISPVLYWDVNDPSCLNVVRKNRIENKEYSFICINSDETQRNILEYKKQFRLTDAQIKQNFLLLNESDIVRFQSEIVIYDPFKENKAVFSYPHRSRHTNPDVVEFPEDVVNHYISTFSEVWRSHKQASRKAGDPK